MMLVEPAVQRAVWQHWWKVLLAVSLALNLFFIIGALWIRTHAPQPPVTPEERLEQAAGALNLDPHQAQAFAKYEKTMRGLFQSMHKSVGPLMSSARTEMAKPGADEAKIMLLFDEAAQERRKLFHDITTTTLSFLATLSPEQRSQFVKEMQQRHRPWSSPPEHEAAR
jgi:Spy/CpxP family protein refolding chaperone